MFIITNDPQGNNGRKPLGERISALAKCSAVFDMLVGYFYFSAMKELAEALEQNRKLHLRVLVGMKAELWAAGAAKFAGAAPKGATPDEVFEAFCLELEQVLGSKLVDKRQFHERISLFLRLLQEGRLEIYKTKEPNHAKLYLFEMDEEHRTLIPYTWITGSSNFTLPGLQGQEELDVEMGQFGFAEVRKYFDALLKTAVPLTATDEQRGRITTIINTKSVAAPITPYEAWLKVVMEFVDSRKGTLAEAFLEETLANAGMQKYKYQRDAVAQAEMMLKSNGGVIIADVVGLGKSIVASLIGKLSRKRGLVICPPALVGDVAKRNGWKDYLATFGLDGWQVFSGGDLPRVREYLERDPHFEMVVVDEVHRFRNMATQDYDDLLQICAGREVVELTATPFNNKPADLLALIHLFSPLKQSNLVPGGDLEAAFDNYGRKYKAIETCRKVMAAKPVDYAKLTEELKKAGIDPLRTDCGHDTKKCEQALKREMLRMAAKMRFILENVAIRRNRIDLKDDPDYSDEVKTVVTPEPPLVQYFDLTPEQDAFYDKVIGEWFGEAGTFKGAVYQPYTYLKEKKAEVGQSNLYSLMRRRLVRRFESSFGAFRQSVENQINAMNRIKDMIHRTGVFFYASGLNKQLDELMKIEDEDEFTAQLDKLITIAQEQADQKSRKMRTTYDLSEADFKKDEFLKDINADIKLFESVKAEYDACGLSENDPKAEALIKALDAIVAGKHEELPVERGDPKRKVVIFTEFTDTLDHLGKKLAKAGLRALVATHITPDVLTNFDASVQEKKQKDDFDILLTTDKLSEGLNLNRAGAVINYDIPWNPTRVIQRVGRINRIGKRVFQKLYILNFFPTLKGQGIVQNKQTAETKLWAIHLALGEDAQFFDPEEVTQASALFAKVGGFEGDDPNDVSFYTQMKKALKEAQEQHPETFAKVAGLPGLVKTAIGKGKDVYLFERVGPAFHSRRWNGETQEVEEVELGDAIQAVQAEFDAPAVPLPDDFWGASGIYQRLQDYKVKQEVEGNITQSHSFKALAVLKQALNRKPCPHETFVREVVRDIQSVGTLSEKGLTDIQNCMKDGEMKGTSFLDERQFDELIEKMWHAKGEDDHYLDSVRQPDASKVIVTIAKA